MRWQRFTGILSGTKPKIIHMRPNAADDKNNEDQEII